MRRFLLVVLTTITIHSIGNAQSMTTVILPQYIEGIAGTNATRIPFAFRAKMTGLVANATYRYFNQVVVWSDAVTSNGAGNCIFATSGGDFVRTSSPSLSTAGTYGTFTTDESGSYEGWFITEPTGNKRFVPGSYIFMRIILNDGGSGTTAATRLTTTDSVRVVKLDVTTTDSTGTGLWCTSYFSPKDFALAYNDTTGSGRPISTSFIESDGTTNSSSNSYATFYADSVDGVQGAFGLVLPNLLPNGIRRFEERSLLNGSIVAAYVDADGVWPSGANTVNPDGGTTPIALKATDLFAYLLTTTATNGEVTKNPEQPTYQYGTTVQLSANPDSAYHFVSWSGDVPTGEETENPLSLVMNQNRSISAIFTLDKYQPTLISPTFLNVTDTSALLGARLISTGNDSVTERGTVWSKSANPTTSDNRNTTSDTSLVYTVQVDGLPQGTLIHFRGYAVNNVGVGYSPEDTFYTLSARPSTFPGEFAAKSISSGQISLTWAPAAGASSYIVLQRIGANPTGLPVDSKGYVPGDTIGDAKVASIVMSGDSMVVSGLFASTSYHFSIVPFGWDGTDVETCNYKTDGAVPVDSAVTLQGPQLTAVILPQYIEGVNGTNTNRVPFAYRARLTGLLQKATYRYANQVVISTDTDSANGGGNCIYVPTTGNFLRTSSPVWIRPDVMGQSLLIQWVLSRVGSLQSQQVTSASFQVTASLCVSG